MLTDERPTNLTEELIECVVHTFYDRVRQDSMLGPIFEARLGGRWDAHLANMVAFWSTVAMRSGRYTGRPHAAHQGLALEHTHFARWLQLFETTVSELCTADAAAFLIDRAQRIAESLQIGLNIGLKALDLPPRRAAKTFYKV
ncbi:group III truncated hemoglobin [Aliihoeflea sp. 2WW]|uniref:group III truncated hemoglobin n=1 Tax=Aliihoeflea sp. 2WW TaxID=1381123 RepID=UPI0004664C8F|nr:group III truncated hemoglobin [Aliihoeflea sp. 2WW]